MNALTERIAREMKAESKADLLKLSARIEVTAELLGLIRQKLSASEPGDVDARDVVKLLTEHRDHDIADREALIAGVEDYQMSQLDEREAGESQIPTGDRFDAHTMSTTPPRD